MLSSVSEVIRRPWGAILVAADYPAVHDANLAWVDKLPKSGLPQVLLEYDEAMRAQGISFRRLVFADAKAAFKTQKQLADMGFQPTRDLGMVRLGVSTCIRNPDLEVREVDTPEEWEVFDAVLAELHAERRYTEEVSQALTDRFHERAPGLKERVYMGLFGGEGAGVATLVPREKFAFLGEVGTRPKFRRKGVARTLVEEVSNLSQQLGFPYVGLMTEWDNEAARTLYGSLGYQPVGEIRGFLKVE